MMANTSLPWQWELRLNPRMGGLAGRGGWGWGWGGARRDAEEEGVTSGVKLKSG